MELGYCPCLLVVVGSRYVNQYLSDSYATEYQRARMQGAGARATLILPSTLRIVLLADYTYFVIVYYVAAVQYFVYIQIARNYSLESQLRANPGTDCQYCLLPSFRDKLHRAQRVPFYISNLNCLPLKDLMLP